MTEKERMLSGKLYMASDPELKAARLRARRLTRLYNATREDQADERTGLLRELLGGVGEDCVIEPTFRVDYGGNIEIGDHFYANFDCIILDVAQVHIGSHVFFGPRVCVYTAGHPIDAGIRNTGLEYGKQVQIGSDVWIGGNTVVAPGVTIGDNVVIGAGSVVTKDIPGGVIAAGAPCRVIREIGPEDRARWQAQADEYYRL